ncbi:DNA repair protein RAD1 [Candida viswanathii]|uniref:DNA repair protein RAD1 n=1 Tax=Candida viswanathii TaxID=5486 RepID=A0A367XNN5_9ASCO|nr:DNA repair protein RAD1 [Candida viswanathii]
MSLFVNDEGEGQQQHENTSSMPVKFDVPEVMPVYPEREINCSMPLRYQQKIVKNTLTKDGLLLLGRGMGWDIILANVIHALSTPFVNLGTNRKKRSLIFIVNANDHELVRLDEELTDLAREEETKVTKVGGETLSKKRKQIYQEGGVICVSSQLLVVDMLTLMINPGDITGLVVFHAERLKEISNDVFLLRLFRDKNNWGFIKAFSDDPELFAGFTPLATKLKLLNVSNVFLWPRFHVTVQESFNIRHKKDTSGKLVTEIKVGLTETMRKIESYLLAHIEETLGQLRSLCPIIANDYWTMDNVYDVDFANRISASMYDHLHRINFYTKQVVNDLRHLTTWLRGLLVLDPVMLYKVIHTVVQDAVKKSKERGSSMRPLLQIKDFDLMLDLVSERAFGKHPGLYNLEELPKWNELGKLVHDILAEKCASGERNQGPVLIVCSTRAMARELSRILETMQRVEISGKQGFSCRKYMIEKLKWYQYYQETIEPAIARLAAELEQSSDDTTNSGTEGPNPAQNFTRDGAPISKRRRTRGGSYAAARSQSRLQTTRENFVVDKAIVQELEEKSRTENDDDELVKVEESDWLYMESDIPEQNKDIEHGVDFVHIDKEQQVIVQAFDDAFNGAILQELHPSHIIMYEYDLAFFRRVETYQAINRENPAKLYLMYYRDSFEEQQHLMHIKKEKEAFQSLIREKASLPKRFETERDDPKFHVRKSDVVNTRIAGGAKFRTEADEMKVVIDSREFKSATPFLIYLSGVTVAPAMLAVGDYILSPKICVERKAIPDLIESFKNGRLFAQCKQMRRFYDFPVLLIEFSTNESFSLEKFVERKFVKGGYRGNNKGGGDDDNSEKLDIKAPIQHNLLRLLYSYPNLQVIWSSSPHETAQIFLQLKANQEEPDPVEALSKGQNKKITRGDDDDDAPPVYNEDAIDFILNIPGITVDNHDALILKVKNIEELVCLPMEQFQDILGKENGKKAFNFINRQYR